MANDTPARPDAEELEEEEPAEDRLATMRDVDAIAECHDGLEQVAARIDRIVIVAIPDVTLPEDAAELAADALRRATTLGPQIAQLLIDARHVHASATAAIDELQTSLGGDVPDAMCDVVLDRAGWGPLAAALKAAGLGSDFVHFNLPNADFDGLDALAAAGV